MRRLLVVFFMGICMVATLLYIFDETWEAPVLNPDNH